MRLYIHRNGITAVGKACEIKTMLKQYRHQFRTVSDWTKAIYQERSKA